MSDNEQDSDYDSMFGDSSDTDEAEVKHENVAQILVKQEGDIVAPTSTNPFILDEESLSDQEIEKSLFGSSDDDSCEEDVERAMSPPIITTCTALPIKSEPADETLPVLVSTTQAPNVPFVEQGTAVEAPSSFASQHEFDYSSHYPKLQDPTSRMMQQIKVEPNITSSNYIQNAATKAKGNPNEKFLGQLTEIKSEPSRVIHHNGIATELTESSSIPGRTNIDPRLTLQNNKLIPPSTTTIPKKRKLQIKSEEIPTNNVVVKQEDSITDKLISQYVSTQHLKFNEHLRPDQYPVIAFDQFWQTMRSWDFIKELDMSSKAQVKIKIEPDQSQESDDESTSNEPTKKKMSLPDEFFCGEQYAALWAPLILKETKAQIISETSSAPIPPIKLTVPVLVTPVLKGDDRYGETLVLNIVLNHRQHSGTLPVRLNAKTHSTQEFLQNDLVLLACSSSVIQDAGRGALNLESSSEVRSSSLISSVSPFIESRLGVIGLVTKRSKHLGDGLVVQIARRLWKKTASGPSDLTLLRIGSNSTGKNATLFHQSRLLKVLRIFSHI